MKPPRKSDDWSGVIYLACLVLIVAVICIGAVRS